MSRDGADMLVVQQLIDEHRALNDKPVAHRMLYKFIRKLLTNANCGLNRPQTLDDSRITFRELCQHV